MKKSSQGINMDLTWLQYDERVTVGVVGRNER
jgi:hypothetical protein